MSARNSPSCSSWTGDPSQSTPSNSPTSSISFTTETTISRSSSSPTSFSLVYESDRDSTLASGPTHGWKEWTILVEIIPPLLTPETIRHAAQASRPYPIYRGTTVCDRNRTRLCPEECWYGRVDHQRCIEAAEATFQPLEAEYVIVPKWRYSNILKPWFAKRDFNVEPKFLDEHRLPYRGSKNGSCKVLQYDGGEMQDDWGTTRCLPSPSRTHEVLADIEREKEEESRGVWTRENYAGIHCDPDPTDGAPWSYGPNNW